MAYQSAEFEEFLAALKKELASYFEYNVATDSEALHRTLEQSLEDAVAFNDSRAGEYETLYVEIDINGRSGIFRHAPTPMGLWTFLSDKAEDGDPVTVTVVSPYGRRTTKDTWPFNMGVATDMSAPAGPTSLEAPTNDHQITARKGARFTYLWGTQHGKPTWWLPRVKVRRISNGRGVILQAGWLLRSFMFGIASNKRQAA